MSRLFLTAVLLSVSFCSMSQRWYGGAVVLATGEVAPGDVSRQSHDVILLKQNGRVMVYPAHRVKSFRYYDDAEDINRQFISHPNLRGAFPAFDFFELVVNGEVGILRKQKNFDMCVAETGEFYYFIKLDNNLLSMKKFRHSVYPKLIRPATSDFDHRTLRLNHADDIVRLIIHYNQTRLPGKATSTAGI